MKGHSSAAAWPPPKVSTAIRSGAAAWARRNWHWLIVVVGLGKATRWTARTSWRAGRWTGRASIRAAHWSAPRMVRLTRQGGRMVRARLVRSADVDTHEMPRPRTGADTVSARRLTAVPATGQNTPQTTTAARPSAITPTGGIRMSTQETQALARAANAVGQMDPGTAWDLDAQLAGMSAASLVLAENIGQYIETLNNIKTDPRVTAQAANAVAQLAELCKTFGVARQTFRTLYAPQFEAAESGVRQIQRQGFFDPRNSSAA